MNITEHYSSPDGILRLIVSVDDDGDVSISFDGYAWHTHGDILASISGLPKHLAVRRFVEDILQGRSTIAVARAVGSGSIKDIWLTEEILKDMRYKPEDEAIEFRHWDGSVATVEPVAAHEPPLPVSSSGAPVHGTLDSLPASGFIGGR